VEVEVGDRLQPRVARRWRNETCGNPLFGRGEEETADPNESADDEPKTEVQDPALRTTVPGDGPPITSSGQARLTAIARW
jgi:hypothetical protein